MNLIIQENNSQPEIRFSVEIVVVYEFMVCNGVLL